MSELVLTLIGPDRPGVVEAVAEAVAAHGGNWLESRMARLAGMFAGILRVELPEGQGPALRAALATLESRGMRIVVEGASATPSPSGLVELTAVGQDHPGIVRDISQVLARRGINIEELITDRSSAPMAGGMLFTARARLRVPPGLEVADLRSELERLAHDLMVELALLEERH
jgi:glycine cleavage system regulatory protein